MKTWTLCAAGNWRPVTILIILIFEIYIFESWISNGTKTLKSNHPELWPGKWAMERQYGAPVAYRERQVMATLSWHKIGGHVTDRGWILNDKLTFILDQSKPYYWMIIQRWIQSRGRWRPLWHCLHWPVVGRESDSLQLLTEHHSYFSLHNNNDNNNNNNNNNSNNNDRLYCKIHSRAQ